MWKAIQVLVAATVIATPLCLTGCQQYGVAGTVREEGYAQPQYLDVPEAPPAAIFEAPTPSPGPDYLWTDGYWHWGGNRYDWHHGDWQRPPSTGQTWIKPDYEKHGDGYRFTPGRWAPQSHPQGQGAGVGIPTRENSGMKTPDRHN
jgi:hypothetical protein